MSSPKFQVGEILFLSKAYSSMTGDTLSGKYKVIEVYDHLGYGYSLYEFSTMKIIREIKEYLLLKNIHEQKALLEKFIKIKLSIQV